MTNVYSKIFYSAGKYVLLKNIFMVIAGLIWILIIRILGPTEYGKYSLVWQLIGTMGPIVSIGWLNALSKFIPEKKSFYEKSILFSQSVCTGIISSLIFISIFLIVINVFPKIIPLEIHEVSLVLIFFVCLVAFFNIFEGMYRGLGKFNEFTIVEGIKNNFGNLIVVVVILLYGLKSYKTIVYINFFIWVIFILILVIILRKYFVLVKLDIDKKIISFVGIIFIGQIIFLLANTIDSILLRALLREPTYVGYYNAGIKIPKVIEIMLTSPLSVPFLYYFSHYETSADREKILVFGSRMLGVICGLIAIFIFSFAKEIVVIVFGVSFLESISVLRIYSLGFFIIGFVILFSSYLISLNKPLLLMLIGFFSTFLVPLICNLILIPKFKSVGPAISSVIGLIFQAVLFLYFSSKNKIMDYKNFIFLIFCVSCSVISGFYLGFYSSLPIFIFLVLITKLFTFKDLSTWKKIVMSK